MFSDVQNSYLFWLDFGLKKIDDLASMSMYSVKYAQWIYARQHWFSWRKCHDQAATREQALQVF
jgi:hypothetical protein